jgi:hypothetical protein
MAVYNGEPYLTAAVRSVLEQDFRNFELVIVDDGSTDRTAQIIADFRDARIRYQRNPANCGQTASLNIGLRAARAPYVARLDADDEYLPGKLSAQVAFLDAHPDIAVLGTWAQCVDEHDRPSGTFRAPTDERDLKFRLLFTSPICHVSVLMRRDVVLAAGGYDEQYRYAADYHLWSKLAARGHRMVSIPAQLMKYRVFSGSFGGASVLGAAGWETAEIIRSNVRQFCGLDLPLDDARAIHLRAHPQWGKEQERLVAYRSLKTMAKSVYRDTPLKVRSELFAALVWSIAQAPPGHAAPQSMDERIAIVFARALRVLKPHRVAALKELVLRALRPAR